MFLIEKKKTLSSYITVLHYIRATIIASTVFILLVKYSSKYQWLSLRVFVSVQIHRETKQHQFQ